MDCIVCDVGNNAQGYGRVYVRGVRVLAHRAAWEEAFGPIPEGLCVLHKCDNPPCINPEHLFLGSRADNAKDRAAKGRNNNRRKLSAGQVAQIREQTGSQRSIARRFGICQAQVSRIRTGSRWPSGKGL